MAFCRRTCANLRPASAELDPSILCIQRPAGGRPFGQDIIISGLFGESCSRAGRVHSLCGLFSAKLQWKAKEIRPRWSSSEYCGIWANSQRDKLLVVACSRPYSVLLNDSALIHRSGSSGRFSNRTLTLNIPGSRTKTTVPSGNLLQRPPKYKDPIRDVSPVLFM